MHNNSKRGGARKGSGRKSEGKIQVSYKLAPDVVSFLRGNDRPASVLIEDAVRSYYQIKHKKSEIPVSG